MMRIKNIIKWGLVACFFLSLPFTLKGQKAAYTEGVGEHMPEVRGEWRGLFQNPEEGTYDKWLSHLRDWKRKTRKKAKIRHGKYLKGLEWIKTNFVFTQMMAHERFFYDAEKGEYTVDKYLDDLEERYGGIDGVLIWPTYPNMGIDNRNQFDMFYGMPGGVEALKKMVDDFHRRGVKVFFPIMIWDNGRLPRGSMEEEFVRFAQKIGIDGLNGDTMFGIYEEFADAFKKSKIAMAFQPQMAVKDPRMLQWNKMGWGEFWTYDHEPGVSITKWLEPKAQIAVLNRWDKDRTNGLQYAFFNGTGFNSWENVWGIWNQFSERDGVVLKKISKIYRHFPDYWSSDEWVPFYPNMKPGVFSSKFPQKKSAIYTFINRDSLEKTGAQIRLPYKREYAYYDLWSGEKLNPERIDTQVELHFRIEGRGYGAILVTKEKDLLVKEADFFAKIKELSQSPLHALSKEWEPLPQQIKETKRQRLTRRTDTSDIVLIPENQHYHFVSKGTMIEGDEMAEGLGVHYPWEKHPVRETGHYLKIDSFLIDKYPVTNRKYKRFIEETGYYPKNDHNYLKDWEKGTYPADWGNKPVTWVSLEDARAYAEWAGKRLPHEWEWQYAAQGPDLRIYPWGNEMDSSKIPPLDSGHEMRPPTDVDAYPEGESFFGVLDMVGNVWQWTDEYMDKHTRAAVLKGGGYYRTAGSDWYFPRKLEVNSYNKYLLMAPSLDRSATIGFRCVVDL